jgi:putative redox protein
MKAIASVSMVSGTENHRQDIRTGRHTLVADEPQHAGGRDAGPAPYDYILSGLGACTAITLNMYAEHKG